MIKIIIFGLTLICNLALSSGVSQDDLTSSKMSHDFGPLFQSRISALLDETTLIIRCWNKPFHVMTTGHISLETKNYYLSFWPKKSSVNQSQKMKSLFKEREGVFAKNPLVDFNLCGEDVVVKLLKTSKDKIKIIDKKMKEMGCPNKFIQSTNKFISSYGTKKYWSLIAGMDLQDEEIANCASAIYEIISLLGEFDLTEEVYYASGAILGSVLIGAFAEPLLLSFGFSSLGATFGLGGLGLFFTTMTFYHAQMAVPSLKLRKSNSKDIIKQTTWPINVYKIKIKGTEVIYDCLTKSDRNKLTKML